MKSAIIVGILLLVGSAVGAKWLMGTHAASSSNDNQTTSSGQDRNPILCWGYFDVEPGIAGLYPRQSGIIIEVKAENSTVKKGDVLLRIDDALAQLKLQEAEVAARGAELQLAEAKLLTKQYELQYEQQEAAVAAVDSKIKTVEYDRKTKLDSAGPGTAQAKTLEEFYKNALDELAEKKKAEQARLKQIGLQDAKLKIAQAEAEWTAKKILVAEATEALKYYQIVAPDNGMVLRVLAHKGETLGPNPKMHAIDFMPDSPIVVRAEVLQEWGRYVKQGQPVEIEDDTYNGPRWEGKVAKLSKWYSPTRTPVLEPFRYNDVRTLECLIEVTKGGDTPKYIGQRVRVKIKW